MQLLEKFSHTLDKTPQQMTKAMTLFLLVLKALIGKSSCCINSEPLKFEKTGCRSQFFFSPSSFSYKVRLFISAFSCFLWQPWFPVNFPLRNTFSVSHRFWTTVCSLSLVFRYFNFLISSVINQMINSILFNLHMFMFSAGFFFCRFFLIVVFQSHKVMVKEDTSCAFSFLKFMETCFLSYNVIYFGE